MKRGSTYLSSSKEGKKGTPLISPTSELLLLLSFERPQSSITLSPMVHAGYVCVAIIHQTLSWTTGSLSCAQMLMHAFAYGGVWTPKESLH